MAEAQATHSDSRSEHPEDTCNRCGGPNRPWYTPSPLWNAVMRGGSIDGPWEYGELICPTCFIVLAEERGIASGWRLHATGVHVELETTTPSGRVWDASADLWRDRDFYAEFEERVEEAERALAEREGWDLDAKRNYGRGVDGDTAAFLRRHRDRSIDSYGLALGGDTNA